MREYIASLDSGFKTRDGLNVTEKSTILVSGTKLLIRFQI